MRRALITALVALAAALPIPAGEPPAMASPDRWEPFLAEGELRDRHDSLVIEDAYRGVLAAHAAGASEAALEALIDIEKRFRASYASRCLASVRKNTFDELARIDSESLFPIAALYVSVWSDHVGRQDLRRARETRDFLDDLVDLYLGHAAPESEPVASRLLVHWARLMVSTGYLYLLETAAETFERAVDYDSRSAVALDAGSVIYERLGRYQRVVAWVERLVELEPELAVARFRLALNRARTGSPSAVAPDLAALARGEEPSWIRILAYQSLVAYHADNHRQDEAIAIAREARQQFPDDEQLAIQLAALLPDGSDSAEIVEQILSRWRGDTGDSSRLLYEDAPARRLRAAALRTVDDVRRRLPALSAALERIPSHDPGRRRFRHCLGQVERLR